MVPPSARRRAVAYLVPYAAMAVGLHGAGSAWLAFLLYHAGMVAVLGPQGVAANLRLLLQGRNGRWLAVAVTLGAGAGPPLVLLRPWLGLPEDLEQSLASLGLSGISWWGFMAYHAGVNPWLEEAFWRGCLGTRDRRVTAGDVLFAGYHLLVLALFISPVWLPVVFVVLAGTSWFWRWTRVRTGGLRVAGVSHFAADLAVMAAVHLLASRAFDP